VTHVSATVPQSSMQVMSLKYESDVISTDGEFDDSQDDVRLQAMSKEDRRTYELMKQSVEYSNGHCQLPVPWRYDYQILPDNIEMAGKRLTGLKRRFQRNPEVHQKYTDQLGYFSLGNVNAAISQTTEQGFVKQNVIMIITKPLCSRSATHDRS